MSWRSTRDATSRRRVPLLATPCYLLSFPIGYSPLLLLVWSNFLVWVWSTFGRSCLSLSTKHLLLFWLAWDDSPSLSLLLDILPHFLKRTTCHAGDWFGLSLLNYKRGWDGRIPHGTCLPCLCQYYFPPRCMGHPCYRGLIYIEVLIALHGVCRNHSVFIRFITSCLKIHKLIRWVFINSMYYIEDNIKYLASSRYRVSWYNIASLQWNRKLSHTNW